jgi:flagellar assembly protein FliH
MRSLSRLVKWQDIRLDSSAYSYADSVGAKNAPEGSPKPARTSAEKEREKVLSQAWAQGRVAVNAARLMAEEIRSEAELLAKAELEKARRAGYEAGFASGMEEAGRQQRQALDELLGLIASIERHREGLLRLHEEELRTLALAIAKKVIDEKLTMDDAAFMRLFQKAVQNFSGQQWLKLTVSDYEAPFATAHAQMLLSMADGAQRIEIITLEGVPKGTCVVETPEGIVDASVDVQMDCLRKAMESA